ncbi:cytochrome b-245 chaperone 1 isoform X1 [Elephas maximus indicus]|uniref:cytochrome b-245 chaperone 1 isoform X1 n=1 Tax=Elephas maximus indicus TaxID=99487 RepID=UPI002116827D|nr:cytochrome b-245 chaperone 1 isoform X1 [Elephas maximus indicus]
MYMQVEVHTSSHLHLKRAPGIRSWSLLVGILSIGLAAAYYSGDSLGWQLFYVTGCLFVAVQNLEDWEEAIFNKSTGKVILKTFSLYRKLLTFSRVGHEQVVVLLSDIRDVNVEEEKVRYFGKGYVVVLRFATVTWKLLLSSSPASWSCTAQRAPGTCLRAATVMWTRGAAVDDPGLHRGNTPPHAPALPSASPSCCFPLTHSGTLSAASREGDICMVCYGGGLPLGCQGGLGSILLPW